MNARSRYRRLLAGLTAVWILALGFLAEGLHEVLVPHRYCAVHETIEHVEGGERAASQEPDGVHLVPDRTRVDHERCRTAMLSDERHALPAGAFLTEATCLRETETILAPVSEVPPRTIAVYRLAPKTSPPAA